MTNEEIIAQATAEFQADKERSAIARAKNLIQQIAQQQQIISKATETIVGLKDEMKKITLD